MPLLARFVIGHRWWVLAAWLLLAVAGGIAAPHATAALSYDFSLPGQPGNQTNDLIVLQSGSGGAYAPIVLVVGDGSELISTSSASAVVRAAQQVAPGARIAFYADQPDLLTADRRTGVVLVYPRPVAGPEAYAATLPALQLVAARLRRGGGPPVAVTGEDALAAAGGSGGSSAGVLAETLFGGVGALVVLLLVFGSALALIPPLIAAGAILATFLIVLGLTQFLATALALALALGIILDATIVRGVLAPALVAALGPANWWWPFQRRDKAI